MSHQRKARPREGERPTQSPSRRHGLKPGRPRVFKHPLSTVGRSDHRPQQRGPRPSAESGAGGKAGLSSVLGGEEDAPGSSRQRNDADTGSQFQGWVTPEDTLSPASHWAQEEMGSREVKCGLQLHITLGACWKRRFRICILTRFPSDFDAH